MLLALTTLSSCSESEEVPKPVVEAPVETKQKQETKEAAPNQGRFVAAPVQELTPEQQEELNKLADLGYVDGIEEAGELIGVTRHNQAKTSGGLNLLTSAHSASAQLIDMEGKVLHNWSYAFREVWPDHPRFDQLNTFWRRTHLFPNGDLLAIYEGQGIIKIDKDSNLLWSNSTKAHHDMQVMSDGSIVLLSRKAHLLPRINAEKPVLEDFVVTLNAEGELIQSVSLLEAMENSEFAAVWGKHTNWDGDLFHTNSLEVLDGRLADQNPAFAKGNVLMSMLLLDLVCVLDPNTKKLVWAKKGSYHYQHDAKVLSNGNLLIFDNQGAGENESRILEMDVATWQPVWTYAGSERQPFTSKTCGLAQRLPNGNTLITESDRGRAFEVTKEGGTVWEYYNPNRAGDKQQFIATMMEMLRLPSDFAPDWLD
ncbi:MAG: hypothetical protein ACI8TQ_000328 [Planctomycetota bacterium]|jgi:hypothetical protein